MEQQIIDTLTYISYAHNRMLSPEISPERWEKVYGPTAEMEQRFQEQQQ